MDGFTFTEPFGRAWRREWLLDPDITYLNHGTVGATPRRVLEAQRHLQDEIERQPAQFLLRELSSIRVGQPSARPGRLRQAAEAVGRFLGARGEDLVFVDNATAGANAVARSLALRTGDEVIVTTLAYGGVRNAVVAAANARDARAVTVDLPFPMPDPWRAVELIDRAITPRTRLVVVDHLAAESAVILPVAEIARRCRARGVLVLVDGAHVPGQLPLDIASLNADFYTANLHKWGWAPRSAGILWSQPSHQPWLYPLVTSWGLDQGFTTAFDWVGTRDPTPWLSAPFAIDLLASVGTDRVFAANHALAWQAGTYLMNRWGTTVETPESMVAAMMTIPLPASLGATAEDAARLRDVLLFDDRIEVQVHAWDARLWIRVSTQIYNDMTDIERLGDAVARRAR